MSQYPITLTGRLTRDPILTKTSTGAYKAKLRVASSRRIPDRQVDASANDPEGHNSKAPQWRDVDHLYIDVEMWNQFAINVRKSLAKGMPLVIVGSLVTEQWRDDQGTDHFRTFIKAQYVGLGVVAFRVISAGIDLTVRNSAGRGDAQLSIIGPS